MSDQKTISVFIISEDNEKPYIGLSKTPDENAMILGSILGRVNKAVESNKVDVMQGVNYDSSGDKINSVSLLVNMPDDKVEEKMKWVSKIVDNTALVSGWKAIVEPQKIK